MKIIRKRFIIEVTTADQSYKETFELDRTVHRIRGILFTADLDNKLFYRSTCEVQINGEEVFPEEYQAKLLMSGLGVAPKNRYFPIDYQPGNYQVKVNITDSTHPTETFSAYQVSMYLEMETE